MATPKNFLFNLNNQWFLTYDLNQWILCKYDRGSTYNTYSFVGSNKDVLERELHRHKVHVDSAGQSKLDKLPFKFLDWKKGMGNEVSS